jgi:hypothetical protein
MMENAICQHALPRCGGDRGLPTYIEIYSFHSSIRSIKRRFLVNLGMAVTEEEEEADVEAAAATKEEEAGVEAMAEETSSSDVDNNGGDRWSRERRGLREFWDKKQNNTGRATIYRFKNISSGSLTATAANSFRIRTEFVLV